MHWKGRSGTKWLHTSVVAQQAKSIVGPLLHPLPVRLLRLSEPFEVFPSMPLVSLLVETFPSSQLFSSPLLRALLLLAMGKQ